VCWRGRRPSRVARLPTIYSPRIAFEKIFGASAGAAMASKARGVQRMSVLDFAKRQTSLLQRKLGKADAGRGCVAGTARPAGISLCAVVGRSPAAP
jgi:hypothetical protein